MKTTAGADDPERCSAAVTVAAAAAVSGVPVSLWLSGEAAWLAVESRAAEFGPLPQATPMPALLTTLVEHGADVHVCAQCASRRHLTEVDIMPGAEISGAATFVAEVTRHDVQALVY